MATVHLVFPLIDFKIFLRYTTILIRDHIDFLVSAYLHRQHTIQLDDTITVERARQFTTVSFEF